MSLLKSVNDRGAVLEWSPTASAFAIGTRDSAGAGFDDYGGELELHSCDFSNAASTDTVVTGSVKARCVPDGPAPLFVCLSAPVSLLTPTPSHLPPPRTALVFLLWPGPR